MHILKCDTMAGWLLKILNFLPCLLMFHFNILIIHCEMNYNKFADRPDQTFKKP